MSTDKKYDSLVLIGRFQPFHAAHLLLAHRATANCEQLIFICGSANQPRTYKNPFNFDERRRMIKAAAFVIAEDGTLNILFLIIFCTNPLP